MDENLSNAVPDFLRVLGAHTASRHLCPAVAGVVSNAEMKDGAGRAVLKAGAIRASY